VHFFPHTLLPKSFNLCSTISSIELNSFPLTQFAFSKSSHSFETSENIESAYFQPRGLHGQILRCHGQVLAPEEVEGDLEGQPKKSLKKEMFLFKGLLYINFHFCPQFSHGKIQVLANQII